MKIRFKSSCVFHGDRVAGEIADFSAPPPDACIVVGAGLAEILEDEPEEIPRDVLEGHNSEESEAEPEQQVKPVKRSAKRKR